MTMTCNVGAIPHNDFMGTRIRKILLGLLLVCGVAAAAARGEWPEIALPKGFRAVDVGGQIAVNGLPMRIKGFVTTITPSRAAEEFRRSLGQPLMENRIGEKLVLGRMQGDFYFSVEIESSGRGSRGAATVANVKLAMEGQLDFAAEKERWLNRLPAGSRLLSHTRSNDLGKSSSHFVISNGLADSVNAARLKSMLAEDGMLLERETKPDDAAIGERASVQGRTLYFRGPNKEAIAVISRANGDTAIVLNIITQLQRIQ